MGSSVSKNNNHNGNSNDSNSSGQGELIDQRYLKLVDDSKASLGNDMSRSSFVQVLSVFSKLLRPLNLKCFRKTVDEMSNHWETIFKCLREVTEIIWEEEDTQCEAKDEGQKSRKLTIEDVEKVEKIYKEYCGLLSETRETIEILVEEAQTQKIFVTNLLNILKLQKEDVELSKDVKVRRNECVKGLIGWLSTKKLVELLGKWSDVQEKLKQTEKEWKKKQNYAERFQHKMKKMGQNIMDRIPFKKILCGLMTVAFLAGSISALVVTGGIAAPFVVIADYVFISSVVGGCVVLTVAAGCKVACEISKEDRARAKAIQFMAEVSVMLKNMITNTKQIQYEINGMKIKQGKVKTQFDEIFSKTESILLMQESVGRIDTFLNKYINDGNAVIQTVEKACKQMIIASH